MSPSTHFVTCPLCEAACGLEVETEGERVTKVRGDDSDPMSRGYLCPKAVALADIQTDADRIVTPLRREGSHFREVDWDTALDDIASRVADIQRRHGRDAAGLYIGNPSVHSYPGPIASLGLLQALGSKNVFTANSIDGLPRILTSFLLYGSPLGTPIPDIDRTDFFLIIGANPLVSNGSMMTAPDCKRRLVAIRERGGTIVVVDPRRTETAKVADRHHFITPGSDALLLAALVRTVLEEKLWKPGPWTSLVTGFEELPGLLEPFAPELVAGACGIEAADIRSLARSFAASPRAICYGRMGTCTQEFGATASWLVDLLNITTNNLDRPGGVMFPKPAVDVLGLTLKLASGGNGIGFGRWRSRVRGLPEFNGEIPVPALAEEIDTPGEGQIRALITYAGNPVLSAPNGRRLDAALASLELMVSIDIYRNETTRHAHYILPTSFGLEHDHHPFLFHAMSVRNFAKYSPAIVPKPAGVRHDYEVIAGLSARIAGARGKAAGALSSLARTVGAKVKPRDILRLAIRLGPRGKGPLGLRPGLDLSDLEKNPHGIDFGPLEPRLQELLGDRKIPLKPELLASDLGRLERRGREMTDQASGPQLLLVGRRSLRSNNSWMHNSQRLVKGRNRCTLLIHPEDAGSRGIAAGDHVRIESRVGSVVAEAEVSDEMMKGVVSLPHGWGHDRSGAKLSVASHHAGVSVNDVTDDSVVDAVSGCASFTGVRVLVEKTQHVARVAAASPA